MANLMICSGKQARSTHEKKTQKLTENNPRLLLLLLRQAAKMSKGKELQKLRQQQRKQLAKKVKCRERSSEIWPRGKGKIMAGMDLQYVHCTNTVQY